jgi:CheY-like chemotaxis protein
MRHATPMSLDEVRHNRSKNYKFLTRLQQEPKNILLIEDDTEFGEVIKELLIKEFPRSTVHLAADPYEAMNFMMDMQFDYIIADWNLPNMKAGHIMELAEKNFGIDPTLNPEWEVKKSNIITFSACDPKQCEIPSSEHFNYLGHIYKKQSLDKIIDGFRTYLTKNPIAI